LGSLQSVGNIIINRNSKLDIDSLPKRLKNKVRFKY